MMKRFSIIILSVLILIVILIFLQSWIIRLPLKDFTSVGQISDTGYIFYQFGQTPTLHDLPHCSDLEKPPINQSPWKYTLQIENADLNNYIFKPVKVWGKVNVKSKTYKPPEIICIKSPCGYTQTIRTMHVTKIELINKTLSSCEQKYLLDLSNYYNRTY
ncbi:hypothetical protein A2767_03915 [Candidatus Roizmanbacteria bacterium RIFCSPHIGHO2_01_FULL_35_10]|nr:MAG: hypothetical protein A2767_03915 [Candidatus Roizmanbacteria bacterium RIFCSPHIGHO2_01_FULL_35_10]